MVDLVAKGTSRRKAAEKLVGKEKSGTLRKDYGRLERDEQLPKPSFLIESRVAALEAVFSERDEIAEAAARDLPAAEKEAEALGLVLGGDDLSIPIVLISSRINQIEEFLASQAHDQARHFRDKGLSLEDASRQLIEMDQEIKKARQCLEAIDKVRRLRYLAFRPK